MEEEKSDTIRINVTLNRDLDRRFRETVTQTLGYKKGNLQIAFELALEEWIREQQTKKRATK
jgi:hypothetical protein